LRYSAGCTWRDGVEEHILDSVEWAIHGTVVCALDNGTVMCEFEH